MGKNVNIVGTGMRIYVHIDSNNKDIWTPGEGPRQRLDYTTLTVKAKYPINFTHSEKRFVLSLHYIRSNSFLFVSATKIYQFKATKSEIKDYALCLGNISKYFAINIMEKNRIKFFFCWF